MQLFFQKIGQGPAFIILHGLYGSSDNWITVARRLANNFTVYLVDLRNHGKSGHHSSHTFMDMAMDINEVMDHERLDNAIVLGHSMGGKAAMLLTALFPDRISKLIIVDIAPVDYAEPGKSSPHLMSHLNIINTMLSINMDLVTSRMEIEQMLETKIPDMATRMFIMKNVQRNHDNAYSWKLNLKTLLNALPGLMGSVELDPLMQKTFNAAPVLFIKGERSDYILDKYIPEIHRYFPDAQIISIPNAGHWIHAEQPELFIQTLIKFVN